MKKNNSIRLKEIREEMIELAEEFENILLEEVSEDRYEKIKNWWLANLYFCLGNNGILKYNYSYTMNETVKELTTNKTTNKER
jgi:hypothetical protein